MTRVAILGGGITGLAAALAALDAGAAVGIDPEVELWEASDRVGGKIATSPFAGLPAVDEGPDAFLVRMPAAVELAQRTGLGDALTSPTGARAAVWHDGLHSLPSDIVLGVPAGVGSFARSGLLSWRGKARAGLEPLLPRTDHGDSIGRLVRARFGVEVHDRLVDALVGSIYATDTDRASLAAVPQLRALADRHRSLLLGGRSARAAAPPVSGPIFAAPIAGVGALVEATAQHAADRGVKIHTGRPATLVEPAGTGGWLIDGEHADAVVFATPAPVTAALLDGIVDDTSALRAIDAADIVMVRIAVRSSAAAQRVIRGRSGYLVPKSRQRLVTAVSFASQKWAHLRPDDGVEVMRVSLGRDGLPTAGIGERAAVDAVRTEVRDHLGLGPSDLAIEAAAVTRWTAAFPQYRPGHLQRVARIEGELPPAVAVAGASYHGIGIPACIASARRAAERVIAGSVA